MATKQPQYRIVYEFYSDTNDMTILEKDITGVYRPRLSYLEEMADGTFQLSRIDVEAHTFINGILSDNKYHPELPAWYAETALKVFSEFEAGIETMVKLLCNDADIRAQAQAFSWIVEYYGTYEFDQYPVPMDAKEAKKWRGKMRTRMANTKKY